MQAKVDEERLKHPKTASLPAHKTTTFSPGTPGKSFVYSPSAFATPSTPATNPFLNPPDASYSPSEEKEHVSDWPQPYIPKQTEDNIYGSPRRKKPAAKVGDLPRMIELF